MLAYVYVYMYIYNVNLKNKFVRNTEQEVAVKLDEKMNEGKMKLRDEIITSLRSREILEKIGG